MKAIIQLTIKILLRRPAKNLKSKYDFKLNILSGKMCIFSWQFQSNHKTQFQAILAATLPLFMYLCAACSWRKKVWLLCKPKYKLFVNFFATWKKRIKIVGNNYLSSGFFNFQKRFYLSLFFILYLDSTWTWVS